MLQRFRYLFIDFNAYFASVEQHDEPHLKGRPVLVAPLKSEYTSAIAVSYEARQYGIKRGTSVREARSLCPDIAVRYARHDRYVQVHREIMVELDRHLPCAKVYSIDEAAFRVGAGEQTKAGALAMAEKIKVGLARNVGPALRSSIGVAASPLLAKLAAESHKPDGITILPMEDLPHRFETMDLTDIPGVGNGVKERLAKAGISTFEELWQLAPKQARAIWGSVQGERFWYQLHGFETEDPPVKKSMIGHSRVLTRDHEKPAEARVVARALLLKAASRLRHYGLYAGGLSLSMKAREADGNTGLRQEVGTRFTPVQDSFFFLKALDDLWEAGVTEVVKSLATRVGSLRLGGVTVYLHRLCEEGDGALAQGDLFDTAGMQAEANRRAKLWRAVDLINADPDGKFARLGQVRAAARDIEPQERALMGHLPAAEIEYCSAPAADGPPKAGSQMMCPAKRHVMLARQQGLDLNYLGAKIAFSRVPEEVEFLY